MNNTIQAGKTLLSVPFMMDPYFRRSVIAICEHGDDGTLGLILNKELDVEVNELITDFPAIDAPVYYGGPVQTDSIQYIHRTRGILEGSKEIAPGVFWGGDFDSLKFLIENQLIKSDDIRFFVGYSGWTEGQLEEELLLKSWVTGDLSANYLFNMSPENVWSKAMEHKGDNFEIIAKMPNEMIWN